jgi:ubiquinone biosynthesis protein UbiJ
VTVAQWIITAGAVVGALGIIYQTLVRPVVKWARRIEKAVSTVELNMMNNGGASLRDAIDRIEQRLDALEKKVGKPTVERKPRTKK